MATKGKLSVADSASQLSSNSQEILCSMFALYMQSGLKSGIGTFADPGKAVEIWQEYKTLEKLGLITKPSQKALPATMPWGIYLRAKIRLATHPRTEISRPFMTAAFTDFGFEVAKVVFNKYVETKATVENVSRYCRYPI